MVVPVANAIAKHCRVFALDTPGYGLSDPPDERPRSLDPYLLLLARTLDALGLQRVCLYGAATGAQIAIEFAQRYPERLSLLVLDTAGHIDEAECNAIVRDYFPSVEPRPDGSHLVTYWHMVRELGVFFPWCVTRAANRIARDMPPAETMQTMLLDYFRAGIRYDWAYLPAFHNERAARAQRVTVPALLTRWEGSIALSITDALIQAGLPPNYRILPLGPTMAERASGIAGAIAAATASEPAITPVATDQRCAPIDRRLYSTYVDTPRGQLHARINLAGHGRPMLVLHSPAGSAAIIEPIAAGWVGKRPVIALDLPGSGESDAFLDAANLSIESYADVAVEALRALGLSCVDVAGRYMGALVGLEMSRRVPSIVADLLFLGVPLFAPHERDRLLAHYTPSIAPRPEGTHLLTAWHMMRDQALWYPYFDRTRSAALPGEPNVDPQFVHRRVVELMKMGDRYQLAYAAEFGYPLAERLPTARCRVTLASARWEAFRERTHEAARLLASARTLTLPDAFDEWADVIDTSLREA
jgi:pimeloyl-ACP methyl ester carboxylesterase